MPLAGEEKTTLSDGPEPPPFTTPSKVKYYSKTITICIYVHIMVLCNERNNRESKLYCMLKVIALVILLRRLSSSLRPWLQDIMSHNSQTS